MTLELDRTEEVLADADVAMPTICLLVDDHEIIVHGLRMMLSPYRAAVTVQSFDSWTEPEVESDDSVGSDERVVALTDPFTTPAALEGRIDDLRAVADRVVVFTFETSSAERLCSVGRADAVIAKSSSSHEMMAAIDRVVRQTPFDRSSRSRPEDCDLAALSAREREVLDLVARGCTNQQIADVMLLSIDTIKTYLRRVYVKLGVENRTQAALVSVGAHT